MNSKKQSKNALLSFYPNDLLLLLAVLFISCIQSNQVFAENSVNKSKVILHLRWHHQFQFAGYYAAIEKGFYAEEGLDVTLLEIKRGTGMITPVIDGTADYGIADSSLLAARMKKSPVILLAQIFQHSPQVFLSLRETGIYTPYDIRGKKAMFDESVSSLNLLFFETLGGTGSFEIVPQSYDLNDLIDKKVDLVSAYLTNEPYQLRKRGIDFNILHPRGYGIDYYGDNLFTSETEVRKNPQRVQKMIRATIKGWQYALKNKKEIIDLIINKYAPNADREKLSYEAEVTEQMIYPDLVPLGDIDLLRYRQIAEGYARLGVIDRAEIPVGFIYKEQKSARIIVTDAEQQWLQLHPEITLGTGQDWAPYVIVAADGTISGIEADLIKRINEIAGTDIRIVAGDRLKIIQQAKAGEIDGLLVSSVQKSLAPYFLFTDSPYNTYKYIFSTTLTVQSMEDLKGKRVAYQRSIPIHENFLKNHPEIISVPADSIDSLALLLLNKKVDAVIGGNIFKYYMQDRLLAKVHPEYIIPGSKEEVVYSIRKDWPELHSIINKALAQLSPSEIGGILDKWLSTGDSENRTRLSLSRKELDWLEKGQEIRVRITDFPPYIIEDQDGQPKGIAIDTFKLIARRTGLTLNFVSSGQTYREALDGIKKHQGPDVIPAIAQTPERQKFILFTRDVIRSPSAIFMRADKTKIIAGINDLIDKKVALHRSVTLYEKIKRDYPKIKPVLFDSDIEAIDALANGKVDAYLGDLTLASYHILQKGYYDLRLAAPGPFGENIFFMGVRDDWPELTSILDKGLANISPEERAAIRNQYISLQYVTSNKGQYLRLALIVTVAASVIILLFFLWNRSLARQVTVRTTELKESGARLKERSDFLDKVIESAALSTWISDDKGTAIRTNPACLEFFGATEDEIIGKYNLFQDVVLERQGVMPEIRQVFEQGRVANLVIDYDFREVDHVEVKNATHKIVNSIFTPIKDDHGKITNVIVQSIDLTDIKRLEKELMQSRKMESIGNLAGGIAHDFNNILASILGFSELALEDVEKGSLMEDNLQEIYAGGLRAKEIVKQILAFARQSDEKVKPTRVDTIITEALKLIRPSTPTTIEIRSEIESSSLVMGNSTQIHQVLLNLCTNAIHAMRDNGGVMEISLKDISIADGNKKFPKDLKEGKYIELVVSDTGHGIAPEHMDSIFEPYFTTKETGEGTGMGLAMVRGIIDSYGGTVIVESNPFQKTVFSIYLPVTSVVEDTIVSEIIEPFGGEESILFVDDEPPIALMGSRILENLGYKVTASTSSLEALELFRANPNGFELVITDMTMPHMTGEKLAMELKRIKNDIRIILCTGYSSQISPESAKEIGINAFTYKPLSKDDLAITVHKVLDASRSPSV